MPKSLRILTISAAALTLVAGLSLLLLTRTYKAEPLRTALEHALNSIPVDSLGLGPAFVTPSKRLAIHDVTINHLYPSGAHVSFSADTIIIDYRPLALIRHGRGLTTVLRSIRLPRGAAPLRTAQTVFSNLEEAGLWLTVKRVVVHEVEVRLTQDDSLLAALCHGRLEIAADSTNNNGSAGTVAADSLWWRGGHHLLRLAGHFALDSSCLEARAVSGDYFGGTMYATGRLTCNAPLLESASIRLAGVDLAAWRTISGSPRGAISGRLDARVDLETSALHLDSLHGPATVTFTEVRARGTPIQRTLAGLLRAEPVQQVTFTQVQTTGELAERTLRSARIVATGRPLSFTSRGWIGLDGRVELATEGLLDAAAMRSLPNAMRRTLIPAGKGRGRFVCTIRGTNDQPIIALEKEMLQRAVTSMFQLYGAELGLDNGRGGP